jgi:putative FmdB family regulatory protein
MPLYEYECGSCGHRFEQIQKFSDPSLTECPKCGGPLRKLVSSPAIQFKGTGWYITDYARSGGKPAGKSEGAAASSEAKSDAGPKDAGAKSDAKPSTPAADSTTKKPA